MVTEFTMTLREADRLSILRRIENKELNVDSGARGLGIGPRQMKRVRKHFIGEGCTATNFVNTNLRLFFV